MTRHRFTTNRAINRITCVYVDREEIAVGLLAGLAITTTRANGDYLCGGSPIGPKWVLTAAHCVEGNGQEVKSIKVLIGSQERDKGDVFEVTGSHVEPGSDLALLELSRNSERPTAALADAVPAVGSTGDVFGWGETGSCDNLAVADRMEWLEATTRLDLNHDNEIPEAQGVEYDPELPGSSSSDTPADPDNAPMKSADPAS